MTLKITSPEFQNGDSIPSKFTCDSELVKNGKESLSPTLKIENVPMTAKSLVLIMDDPDIPDFIKESRGIEVFDHWILFNILPSSLILNEGESEQGERGLNSKGQTRYIGPCPPDKEHRYFFKLYALDKMLSLTTGATRLEIDLAMKDHIIEQAELMAKYKRI